MSILIYLSFCPYSQHPVVPDIGQVDKVTHVALAFLPSSSFAQAQDGGVEPGASPKWPLFISVEEARARFAPDTKILVSIGGWGDTAGFSAAARTPESRRQWASRVADMVRDTGADGVDVDWEYPG